MVAWSGMLVVKEDISDWHLVEVIELKSIYNCKVQILRHQPVPVVADLSSEQGPGAGCCASSRHCAEVWIVSGGTG